MKTPANSGVIDVVEIPEIPSWLGERVIIAGRSGDRAR
jgi:hypothetical protein